MGKSTNNYEHIISDLKDWPICQFSDNRDAFIKKLTEFVLNKYIQNETPILDLLNKTIYLEKARVKNKPWKVDPSDEKEYWTALDQEVSNTKKSESPEIEQAKILKRIITRYSEEIIGHFIPKTHLFARKFLTAFFKRLYNNGWGRGHKGIWGNKADLLSNMHLDGYTDEIRSLFQKGTVVIVPTHYSNLDSIMIAYSVDAKLGIPAFSYGAGLNLYDVELLAYYMNRLGAYRVDRRKKNPIYLETLKSMASLSLLEGLNHIFFPGGTRSRSGAIEDKLKLGLLNSVIDAQRHSILNNLDKKIFVVPLAIGYHFVLEAGSLIDQHLRVTGKEKYSRTKKKKSIFKTIYNFLVTLRKKDSEVYLSFGRPLDVLGNNVDINGDSFDSRGSKVDIKTYFSSGDVLNEDIQRESIYTKLLANKIVQSFKSENIVLTSHLVAFTLFRLIQKENPNLDLYELLKLPTKKIAIPLKDLSVEASLIIDELRKLKEKNLVKPVSRRNHKRWRKASRRLSF